MGQENTVPRRINKVEGAVGQAILSGGPGALETWGGGAATMEFSAYFEAGTGTLESNIDYRVYSLDATQIGYATIKVPHDFNALTSCKVKCFHSANENIDWTVDTDFATDGEAKNANTDTDTADAVAMTLNQMASIDISLAFTGIAAEDTIGIKFTLDVAAAGILRLLEIVFKYS